MHGVQPRIALLFERQNSLVVGRPNRWASQSLGVPEANTSGPTQSIRDQRQAIEANAGGVEDGIADGRRHSHDGSFSGTGGRQILASGASPIKTIHAPQCPSPQPYLLPVRPSLSRRTVKSDASGGQLTKYCLPLTSSSIDFVIVPPCS